MGNMNTADFLWHLGIVWASIIIVVIGLDLENVNSYVLCGT